MWQRTNINVMERRKRQVHNLYRQCRLLVEGMFEHAPAGKNEEIRELISDFTVLIARSVHEGMHDQEARLKIKREQDRVLCRVAALRFSRLAAYGVFSGLEHGKQGVFIGNEIDTGTLLSVTKDSLAVLETILLVHEGEAWTNRLWKEGIAQALAFGREGSIGVGVDINAEAHAILFLNLVKDFSAIESDAVFLIPEMENDIHIENFRRLERHIEEAVNGLLALPTERLAQKTLHVAERTLGILGGLMHDTIAAIIDEMNAIAVVLPIEYAEVMRKKIRETEHEIWPERQRWN